MGKGLSVSLKRTAAGPFSKPGMMAVSQRAVSPFSASDTEVLFTYIMREINL